VVAVLVVAVLVVAVLVGTQMAAPMETLILHSHLTTAITAQTAALVVAVLAVAVVAEVAMETHLQTEAAPVTVQVEPVALPQVGRAVQAVLTIILDWESISVIQVL